MANVTNKSNPSRHRNQPLFEQVRQIDEDLLVIKKKLIIPVSIMEASRISNIS